MKQLIKKICKFILVGGYQAKILYRIAHFFEKKKLSILAMLITRISIILNNIEISPLAEISKSVEISHGIGTVIGSGTVIGENVWIRQNVTIGRKSNVLSNDNNYPIIQKNVEIGAGVVILGNVTVGENVIIGANSVITKDVPPNCVVAGAPFKIIRYL